MEALGNSFNGTTGLSPARLLIISYRRRPLRQIKDSTSVLLKIISVSLLGSKVLKLTSLRLVPMLSSGMNGFVMKISRILLTFLPMLRFRPLPVLMT